MAELSQRRIVTGLDGDGRSTVIIDGPVARSNQATGFAWCTATLPADNSGSEDTAGQPFTFGLLHGGGSNFMVAEYPPGMGSDQSYWHATDTIDYIVVLRGEIVLELEAGEARAKAGDLIVDRGVLHSWRNDGDEVAATAIVTIPAHPVGEGRTV